VGLGGGRRLATLTIAGRAHLKGSRAAIRPMRDNAVMSIFASAAPTGQRILDAAQRLMQAHGYHGVSFADVAAAVGIRKASVFHHFPTKEDLARAVVARYRLAVRDGMDAIDQATDDPLDKLARYAGLYRALLARGEYMCLCGLLAAEALTLPESVRAEVRAYFDEHEAWLGDVLAAGRAAGMLRVQGSPDGVAQRMLAGFEGALLVARAHDDDARFDVIADGLLADLRAGA